MIKEAKMQVLGISKKNSTPSFSATLYIKPEARIALKYAGISDTKLSELHIAVAKETKKRPGIAILGLKDDNTIIQPDKLAISYQYVGSVLLPSSRNDFSAFKKGEALRELSIPKLVKNTVIATSRKIKAVIEIMTEQHERLDEEIN